MVWVMQGRTKNEKKSDEHGSNTAVASEGLPGELMQLERAPTTGGMWTRISKIVEKTCVQKEEKMSLR